ncbi:MAG: phosphoribosyl-ATP diphosphatase [Candidatus Sumerlaeia bacterium]|nr:phosphoribosyl-ATP diphosphatase [Candidatus Sumerlaeia bacterium]
MIVPSIDLMDGQSVQLIGGRKESRASEREYGDPIPLARKFRLAGDIAVIDLDAAFGKGSNREMITKLVREAPCRVGGGIRDVQTAQEILDLGAKRVILGTAAKPEILRELPRDRTMAALDAYDGEVVVEGWQTKTGEGLLDRIRELKDIVGSFLVTFVEKEGRMQGTDMKTVAQLIEIVGKRRLTIAGGVTTCEEIAELDKMGADAQVGMAIYTGKMDLGDAIAAPLTTDRPDGLFSTIVTDEHGIALGLAYSSRDSIREAVRRQLGIYQSRKRGLWVKGESSGNTQELLGIALDCDRDAVRFTVRQQGGGFCHLPQFTCFGNIGGLTELQRTLWQRRDEAPEGSYTKRLYNDRDLLASKLQEEARELSEAETPEEVAWEAADLIYFAMVRMAAAGVPLSEVEKQLDLRSRKVNRRPGDAKK